MAQRYLDHEMLLVGPGLKTGMAIRYDNPREIGPDRLVNAVAGYERVGRRLRDRRLRDRGHPRRGERGGRVPRRRDLPGRRDLSGGVVRARRRAADDRPVAAAALIGKSTVDAIRAGVLYGFAGMVDGIIGRLHEELGELPDVGHGRARRARSCRTADSIDEADDLLTLTGLRIIWERNQSLARPGPPASGAGRRPSLGARASRRLPDAPAHGRRLAGAAAAAARAHPRRWSRRAPTSTRASRRPAHRAAAALGGEFGRRRGDRSAARPRCGSRREAA